MFFVGDLASWGVVSINMFVVFLYVFDSVCFSSDVDDFMVLLNDIGVFDDVYDLLIVYVVLLLLFVDIGDTFKSCDKLFVMIFDVNCFVVVLLFFGVFMIIDGCILFLI